MYNTFGDKRALFRLALNRYLDQNYKERARCVSVLPPRQSIAPFLDEVIDKSVVDPEHKGCMTINSAIDVAPHDPELRPEIEATLVHMETFLRGRVEEGQKEDTITKTQTADDLARLLLGALVSIRALSRERPERELLKGLIRPVYALLDAAAKKDAADQTARRPPGSARVQRGCQEQNLIRLGIFLRVHSITALTFDIYLASIDDRRSETDGSVVPYLRDH